MNQITFQNAYQSSTTANFSIGQQAQTPDGNIWIYVQASTGGLAKGSIAIPDTATDVDTVSSSTNNLGQIVYITEASAGWTNGQFAGDYVTVNDGTGVGQLARIMDNTSDTLILFAPGLTTALSVSDSDIIITKPWKAIKAAVTSKKQNATGIAQVAIAASSFGWLLQRGIGVVMAGIALTATADFTTGDDTAGQATIGITTDGQFDAQSLGRSLVTNAAADQATTVFVDIV